MMTAKKALAVVGHDRRVKSVCLLPGEHHTFSQVEREKRQKAK